MKKQSKKLPYHKQLFIIKFFKFFYMKFKDFLEYKRLGYKPFNEWNLSLFTGRQGTGKTMAMVEYLDHMKKKYPDVLIVTNFGYKYQDYAFTDWNDFFNLRNGEKGIIFAIDELQNEFSSTAWKNFPESLLSEITQQRKQRVKIVATSQVFTRVAKQLREQTSEVIECVTLGGRWTFTKAFDSIEYEYAIANPETKNKLKRLWRKNFIQTDELRDSYDTYAKIERMTSLKYFDRYKKVE